MDLMGYEYYIGMQFSRYNVVTRQVYVLQVDPTTREEGWVMQVGRYRRPWSAAWVSREEFFRRWKRTMEYMYKGTQKV